MTTDLATVPEIHKSWELSGRDRVAAQAVADGIRDAKAENTRRSYASAWRRFQEWGRSRRPHSSAGHPAGRGPLPGPPGSNRPVHRKRAAGTLGHIPLPRRRRRTEGRQSRAPPGGGRGHQGLAQPGPGTQAGRRPDLRRPGPGPRGSPPAQTRPRRQNGINGHRQQARRPGSSHHRGPGRRRTQALRGGLPDLG